MRRVLRRYSYRRIEFVTVIYITLLCIGRHAINIFAKKVDFIRHSKLAFRSAPEYQIIQSVPL